MDFTTELKAAARTAGFELVGVCPAVTPAGIHRFYEWLALGYGGAMEYLARRAPAYAHPQHVLDNARSLLMLGMNYHTPLSTSAAPQSGYGRVSTYAHGTVDYHDLIHARLKPLARMIEANFPGSHARGVVDSAPLLEREFAQLAGLGWVGKHTLLINRQYGSWFFLAAVLTDAELAYDKPFETDHCGTCTACLDNCPTQAFPQPMVLDATRCISYLTIELRESIPESLRNDLGDWVFGCDICQSVCPWNRKSPLTQQPEFAPQSDFVPLDLHSLFRMSDEQFRRLFRQTPMWRVKRRGLLRNAAIVLGNQRQESSISTLELGRADPEPVVREACDWALTKIASGG
ncbi:MAG: tRNA epoxyqueuosine(34) reductase QueG [Planctomycetales bacterium]|nr:tRNA epoxyqueuosine(34) reductase QueG [Planctomycetales bacterium]